jgi:hypothetical protein
MRTPVAVLAVSAVAALGAAGCAATEEPGSLEQSASTTKAQVDKPKKKKDKPTMTAGQRNALESAESYLDGQAFSKSGLIKQLKFEHFSKSDARWAVNHVKVSWMKEAVESAEGYLDGQAFSRQSLIDQLKFEGFTQAQAEHGVSVAYN